jgi:prepilin-type N-terminal cleavage/methylation domain-containing protein
MSLRVHRRSQNGFTLIEVMLAAVVMLAGIVGMMQAITSGSEMLDVSRKQTVATQIIHGEIEKVRVSDWSDITALPISATVPLNSTFQASSPSFTCTRAVTPLKKDPITNEITMDQITYTVTWTGSTGRAYSRSGSTYVGKNGLYVAYQR